MTLTLHSIFDDHQQYILATDFQKFNTYVESEQRALYESIAVGEFGDHDYAPTLDRDMHGKYTNILLEAGWMAWRRCCKMRQALAGGDKLVSHWTVDGKGGDYVDLGVAIGAGTSKGDLVQVYRDTTNGQMYFREPEDFIGRLKPLVAEAYIPLPCGE